MPLIKQYMRVKTNSLQSVEELSFLYDISQLLESSLELSQVIQPVIDTIASSLHIVQGAITLLDRRTGEISIEASCGLSTSQRSKGRYQIGEGITGKVVASGQREIIPDISVDPRFLNRTGIEHNNQRTISFLCIPIRIEAETIGALSAHKIVKEQQQLEDDARLLTVVSAMIAQAVRLRRDFMEEKRQLEEENSRLHRELEERFRPSNIIGRSAAMQLVFDMIAQVCKSDATVLIRGESGTGKELVAQAIHYNSYRSHQPFIRVNCGALPESIIESELFGHERGSFTGATSARTGRFEMANGGSIFLDEIGDLSPNIQIKILRILQEREFERVGGSQTIHANVRIIAATNQPLEELMQRKQFREDLYYRLNVFPIHIPPLRERKSDLLLLAEHFTAIYAQKNHKKIKRISTPAINMLTNYHWPGNVRELENCIERAILLSTDGVIHGQHLPPSLQSSLYTNTAPTGSLQEMLENYEREFIIEALKSTRGNMAKAAELLQISSRIMGLRVHKFHIRWQDFR